MNNLGKITVTKETIKVGKVPGFMDEIYYVNGVKVCSNHPHMESFCSIGKGGAPSNIRDKSKRAVDVRWDRAGLIKLLGTSDFKIGSLSSLGGRAGDFNDDYPDTTWGYPGRAITTTGVRSSIEDWIESRNIKLSNLFEKWDAFIARFDTPVYRGLANTLKDAKNNIDIAPETFVDTVLSNFATLSGYMAYSPEELEPLKRLIATDQQTVANKLFDLWGLEIPA
jgi:hypothetical protein